MSEKERRSYFIGGIILSLLGAICFSTKAIFVKLAYRDTDVDAVALLALRMIFSLPFFLVFAFRSSSKSDNVKFTSREWIGVALVGALGYYVSSLLDFLGLQYISAGIERLVLFIYPTLVLLISAIVFKQKITLIQGLAVAITYVGLIMAFVSEANLAEGNSNFYVGSSLIFACAITYAMYVVGSGRLIPKVGAAKFNSYAMTSACIGVLLHFFIFSNDTIVNLAPSVYGYGVIMAILSTVIPSFLVSEGIKRIGSNNAAIVGSIGPVSTIIQANIFLYEPVTAAQIIGTVLILVGVFMIGRQKKTS